MKRLMLAVAVMALATAVHAQTLTKDQARRFVDSLPEVTKFGNTLDESLQKGAFDEEMRPEPGEPFKPYARGMAYLKSQDRSGYNELAGIVDDYGFNSPTAWATTGDRLFLAYMASEMKNADMPQNLTPEMIEKMPKSMQEQMKGVMAMMKAAQDVPPEHMKALEAVKGDLEAYMKSQGMAPR